MSSTPSSVVEYVLNGHLINTGTEGPTKLVGPKGLTFLRIYSIQVALLQVLPMSFKFNFFLTSRTLKFLLQLIGPFLQQIREISDGLFLCSISFLTLYHTLELITLP